MDDSGQPALAAILYEQARTAEGSLEALQETLNPQIDANPNDKLMMEMLDVATDAQESLADLRELIETMRQRDQRGDLG